MIWIQTHGGGEFHFTDIDPADIAIGDIAVSLSRQCRFLGHCRAFYSVAQHCVLAADLAGADRVVARWALLHDAAEAYLGDLPGPLRRLLPDYVALDRAIMAAVAERFGLPLPSPAAVKEIDARLLATEAAQLMGPAPRPWGAMVAVPYDLTIEPLPQHAACEAFLAAFDRLFPDEARRGRS